MRRIEQKPAYLQNELWFLLLDTISQMVHDSLFEFHQNSIIKRKNSFFDSGNNKITVAGSCTFFMSLVSSEKNGNIGSILDILKTWLSLSWQTRSWIFKRLIEALVNWSIWVSGGSFKIKLTILFWVSCNLRLALVLVGNFR